jgi:tetratricopeptide (TPR) repeat protein
MLPEYSYLYSSPGQEVDLITLSHQVPGEKALSMGYYEQAIQDFGRAIEFNPTNPIPYLQRGIAHFSSGQYENSIEDYKQFASQAQESAPFAVSEFTVGFVKGLPQGVYDSGEGLLLFMTDCVKHPIETSKQMINSITTLVDLVRKDEWGVVAEALSPEVHQLVTEWDILSSEKRGELAGYAVGKHGADILAPGAIAKVTSKCVKSAQELVAICKSLEMAQETLILETAAGIGSSVKIAEIVKGGQRTARIADDLGISAPEMGQLKRAGTLEETIIKNYEHLSPSLQESCTLYKKAQNFLKPYAKNPMLEDQVRVYIHETGIPTFLRPNGIPENYLVKITDKGAGMEYIHPKNTHLSVRVMPGKPHSPFLHQQKPYVVQMTDGKAFDKNGNLIDHRTPEAHILLEEFIYRE